MALIHPPQIFKPFAVFLRWVGQEDTVFAVILGGGGGPVIRASHHAHIIKDGLQQAHRLRYRWSHQ